MSDKSIHRVGYRQPPKETQFKKGKSGNPNGRPKGARNQLTMFEDVMLEEVEYTENGKRRRRPALELIFLRLRQRGLKDDNKAVEIIIRLFQQFGMSRAEAEPIDQLLDEDAAILEDFVEQKAMGAGRQMASKDESSDDE